LVNRRSAVDEASETLPPSVPPTRGAADVGVGPARSVRGPTNARSSSKHVVPPAAPAEPALAQAVIDVHVSVNKELRAELRLAHERNGVLQEKIRILKEEQEKRAAEGPVASLRERRDATGSTKKNQQEIRRDHEEDRDNESDGRVRELEASKAKLEVKIRELTDEYVEIEGYAVQYKQDYEKEKKARRDEAREHTRQLAERQNQHLDDVSEH
jgi:hypothetical protein